MVSIEDKDVYRYYEMLSSTTQRVCHQSDVRFCALNCLLEAPPHQEASKCLNSNPRADMWLRGHNVTSAPAEEHGKFQLSVIPLLGILCQDARVGACQHAVCLEEKEAMASIAPGCSWEAFRDWALVAMSCQATSRINRNTKTNIVHFHLANAVKGCVRILGEYRDFSEQFSEYHDGFGTHITDLVGICDLVHWMSMIQSSMGIELGFEKWDHQFLPPHISLHRSVEAWNKARQLTICKTQLWNAVSLAERTLSDLPAIVDALGEAKALCHDHDGRHQHCTPTRCQVAYMNTARVGQLHKCPDTAKCSLRLFDLADLLPAVERGNKTAWLLDLQRPRLAKADEKYIAISHVWSDGTGVGLEGHGRVNHCLSTYFANLTRRFGCVAIWWDTLSIPLDDKARGQALSEMHNNYANAEFTVVHDSYLLATDYTDPGTACLAIMLSPWFTRGWTALELAMSNTVKVLFKGSDSMTPDIKDLDHEILASSPATVSRTHWLASCMIRRVRKRGEATNHITDLLAILRPRTTSWLRDRTVITGLLAKVKWDYTDDESEIIRKIIVHLGSVPYNSLLHGQSTMFEYGPFSWCPASFDDMPMDIGTDMNGDLTHSKGNRMLEVDRKGVLTGLWGCRGLSQAEVEQRTLQPYGRHPEILIRVQSALIHWECCLLLKGAAQTNDEEPFLLVTTFGLDEGADYSAIIDCGYVGAVVLARGYDRDREIELDRISPWGCYEIRLGKETEKPCERQNACDLLNRADEMENAFFEQQRQRASQGDPWYPDTLPKTYEKYTIDQLAEADSRVLNAQLAQAVDEFNSGAMRHLIRQNAQFFPDQEDILGERGFYKLKHLGDAYLAVGMREKGDEMYTRVATLLFSKQSLGDILNTRSMDEFSEMFLSQGRRDLTEMMYKRVRDESNEAALGQGFFKRLAILKLEEITHR
ncbi:hypothetical protein F4806DRAFT_282872 [Annulohypoxylon nitens]|nr:hypothetical protein F4806DRAFT_282872 [Annulohypoxylon nitens]